MSNKKIPNQAKKARLWAMQNGICNWCNKPLYSLETATMDHIIPKSHGGTLEAGNVQLLHFACNQEKGDQCPGCPRCEIQRFMADRKQEESMKPEVYFKMPPRIEAVKLRKENVRDIIIWMPRDLFIEASAVEGDVKLVVMTPGGPYTVKEGYWVCRRYEGTFFFCTPEQFTAVYAPWLKPVTP